MVLCVGGREVLTGWWADPDVAEAKYDSYVEEFRDQPGTTVRLTEADEQGREWELGRWPDASRSRSGQLRSSRGSSSAK
ncbi:hypothetical protein [Streptomyces sp. SGAir0957]